MDNIYSETGNLEYLPGQQKMSVASSEQDDALVTVRTPEDVIVNFSQMLGDIGQEYLNISSNKVNRAADIQAKHFALLRAGIREADGVYPDQIEDLYEDHKEEASEFINECRQHVARGHGMPSSVISISSILGNRALGLISSHKKDAMLLAQAAARMVVIADSLDQFYIRGQALDSAISEVPLINELGTNIYNVSLAITLPHFSHIGRFQDEAVSVSAGQAANHLCYIFLAILREAEHKDLWMMFDDTWQTGAYKQLYTDAIRAGAHYFFGLARESFMNCAERADQAIVDIESVQENISRILDISVPEGQKIPDFHVIIDTLGAFDLPAQCKYVIEERIRQVEAVQRD